jgi:fatty acid desaturase
MTKPWRQRDLMEFLQSGLGFACAILAVASSMTAIVYLGARNWLVFGLALAVLMACLGLFTRAALTKPND